MSDEVPQGYMRMKSGKVLKIAKDEPQAPPERPAHPNAFDRVMEGREHSTRGDYAWRKAGGMRQGDGYWHENKSWVVTGRREHDKGVTFVAEPRNTMVNREIVSTMQFGVPGITLDEQEEVAHTFHPDQVVPVRQ